MWKPLHFIYNTYRFQYCPAYLRAQYLHVLCYFTYVNIITDKIRLFADDCILYQHITTTGDCTSLQSPAGYYQTLQLVSHLADGLQYKEVPHSEHLT